MPLLNVAIYPPRSIQDKIVSLSGQILSPAAVFAVDGKRRLPHLTIYMADFDDPRAATLVLRERLAGDWAAHVEIGCDAVGITRSNRGYVEISYLKTAALERVQLHIAEALGPLARMNETSFEGATDAELRSLKAHKYEFVGDTFRPHITIGRVDEQQDVIIPGTTLEDFSFISGLIIVGQADHHGSVHTITERVPLHSPQ